MDMNKIDHTAFLESIYNILVEEKVFLPGDLPVTKFRHPEELKEEIDFSIGEPVEDIHTLTKLCRQIIDCSVKTSHPNFHNQLYGGVDIFGLGASWISEALNTNQHTYEIAPSFTLTEQFIIKHVLNKFGYMNGDGIFAPGGSMSNMYSMVLARFKLFPQVKSKGLHAIPVLVAFTSEESHYSFQKAAHWLGIGTENVIKIKSDNVGKMILTDLEKQIIDSIDRGLKPFYVNATAGTTVLGAIDPLDNIAEICRKYRLWFHVDACLGGSLILSDKYRHRLQGIEKSDSISWNPHKMLGAPLQCSLFLTRHNNLLLRSNCASASYLFQEDKFYDTSYDTGDKSIQCGRKVHSFKLWVMWKARGDDGFEKLVDNSMECATYFKDQIENRPGFQLIVDENEANTVCFFYIPLNMRNGKKNETWLNKLNMVAPMIKEKMILCGTLMIGYSPLKHKGLGNFFRMVVSCHPTPSFAHMDYVITEIEKFGMNLEIEL